ncbi:MAG TPA: helix-turn-helix domain-containing protein [Egicoccus sp.]|nr:helix-turn-helix domain-containing protein [Egicoccus sp.]HSK22519.1 helix-turn-helix domain-containing protein [Egicoccus sp.]
MRRGEWRPIVELLDTVSSRADLVDDAVRLTRDHVPGIGRLPPEDVARHTRALLAAATRAIAERRGPSDAELDFIEELAVTRARQQVPIEAVLRGIHLAGQAVWRDARRVAEERAVPAALLLDARELYEQWAEAVRARLLVAHRQAELAQTQSMRDRRVGLLRRALDGGPDAPAALRDAGFAATDGCWVVHARPADAPAAAALEQALRTDVADLFGVLDDALVGVTAARPDGGAGVETAVAVAGPLDGAALDLGDRWARQAWTAAAARGRSGVVDVRELALEADLLDNPALAGHVADGRLATLAAEGTFADVLLATVAAYAEHRGHVPSTAAALYVHPNTVRHRLRRLAELTDLDLDDPFDLVTAWWLARWRVAV